MLLQNLQNLCCNSDVFDLHNIYDARDIEEGQWLWPLISLNLLPKFKNIKSEGLERMRSSSYYFKKMFNHCSKTSCFTFKHCNTVQQTLPYWSPTENNFLKSRHLLNHPFIVKIRVHRASNCVLFLSLSLGRSFQSFI